MRVLTTDSWETDVVVESTPLCKISLGLSLEDKCPILFKTIDNLRFPKLL